MLLSEINLRDPFVLVEGGCYYLYGTRGPTCWGPADGFDVYASRDLVHWDGPTACFHNDGSFWADRNYWAPEVHRWKGGYYMFASFKGDRPQDPAKRPPAAPSRCRGTAILRADTPVGPFAPWSNGPVTPAEWECLDGTFYADDAGRPWMVFCHEWVQAGDGTVCALPLTDDLRGPAGEPEVLFRGSDAPWKKRMRHSSGAEGYVTDGPFLWRLSGGALACLWASFSQQGYAQAQAVSDSGSLAGPWRQAEPLFMADGGHGMVFRALDGGLRLALHSPNEHLMERPVFFTVAERDGILKVVDSHS